MAIKLKRGLEATIPTLQEGEPGFTTDSKKLFVGSDAGNIEIGALIEVTWQELKDKRDASLLTPGQQYRITDHECTTVQADTQSAGHQFDIIVTADSVNKLNENARACHHDFSGPVTSLDDLKTNHTYEVEITTDANKLLELESIITNENYNLAIAIKKNIDEKYIGFKGNIYNATISLLYTAPNIEDINEEECTETGIKQFTYNNEYEIALGTYNIFDYLTITDITGNYFANSKLESWKLKYCLDNDTTRFAWADTETDIYISSYEPSDKMDFLKEATIGGTHYYIWKGRDYDYYVGTIVRYPVPGDRADLLQGYDELTNEASSGVAYGEEIYESHHFLGKGVIYRMIDEFNNDIPYDFKNIQFLRDGIYYFTFTAFENTDETIKDASIMREMSADDMIDGMTYNYMKPYYIYEDDSVLPQALNFNIFKSYYDDDGSMVYMPSNNRFDLNCYNNFFDGTEFTRNNTFGNDCHSNTFGNACYSNTFGDSCYLNTFGDSCSYNTFGSDCYSNTFGTSCFSNTFGNSCHSNTFGSDCYSNTFGNDCYYLKITENSVTKKYLNIDNGLQGASSANQLELYDSAIADKTYQISFKKASSGRYLMLWATDTGAMTGKYKALNTDLTWTDL